MLKGFKNAAELDFTIDENKVKMEEAFQLVEKEKGSVFPLIINGERIETRKRLPSFTCSQRKCSDMHVLAARNLLKRLFRERMKHLRNGALLR